MKTLKTLSVSVLIIIVFAIIAIIIGISRNSAAEAAPAADSVTQKETVAADTTPPKTVSLEPAMLTMGTGEKYRLNGAYDSGRPASGAAYSCDRSAVLSVDANTGDLTAADEGYAEVTVKSPNGLTDKSFVTVKKAPTSVAFSSPSLKMQKGEVTSLTINPVADDEGFAAVKYTSADPKVVSVSENGTITAASAGSTKVSASVFNGKSTDIDITVLDNSGFTEKTTENETTLRKEPGWQYPEVATVPAGSKVQQFDECAGGRWLKVKYNDAYGWIYNKAFGDVKNYSEFTVKTLPVMADDLLFDIGTDKRDIFDFVYDISYDTNEDDTTENLCVYYFKRGKGSCYNHGAMLCYLYNRCGYETLRLVGKSAYDGVSGHSWCLSKTDEGWRHVDAQNFSIRDADDQFFVKDYSQYFKWDFDKFPATELTGETAD